MKRKDDFKQATKELLAKRVGHKRSNPTCRRPTVFGTFAFCPDCGRHNSLQILEKNLADTLNATDCAFACHCFQKRHLLAHKMGIVDETYIRTTGEIQVQIGRKAQLRTNDVVVLLSHIERLGARLLYVFESYRIENSTEVLQWR